MTAKSMRSFAGGLIVAASVCGAIYFFSPSEATSTKTVSKPSVDEMKSELANQGYVIHTEEEWNETLAAEKAASDDVKNETKKESKEKIVYRTIISVTSGMTSVDVGRELVRAKIINSGIYFYKEVEKRGLSNSLRPGAYEIDSDMTRDEIIKTIYQ
jgi:antirestriction protein